MGSAHGLHCLSPPHRVAVAVGKRRQSCSAAGPGLWLQGGGRRGEAAGRGRGGGQTEDGVGGPAPGGPRPGAHPAAGGGGA